MDLFHGNYCPHGEAEFAFHRLNALWIHSMILAMENNMSRRNKMRNYGGKEIKNIFNRQL